MRIALYHAHYDEYRLASVTAEMLRLGAPNVKAVWSSAIGASSIAACSSPLRISGTRFAGSPLRGSAAPSSAARRGPSCRSCRAGPRQRHPRSRREEGGYRIYAGALEAAQETGYVAVAVISRRDAS